MDMIELLMYMVFVLLGISILIMILWLLQEVVGLVKRSKQGRCKDCEFYSRKHCCWFNAKTDEYDYCSKFIEYKKEL